MLCCLRCEMTLEHILHIECNGAAKHAASLNSIHLLSKSVFVAADVFTAESL